MKLGVTGSMGSGKSTAAALLEELGYRRLDSDQIIRTQVLTDPVVLATLRDRFGPQILDGAGAVDRRALAGIVFKEDDARLWLEEVLHPRVFAVWQGAFTADPTGHFVVEVPLLYEKRLEKWFDFVICVASSSAPQLARLEKRGIPHALAEERISKQLPLALKLELADFVLWNDGSRDFLREQLEHLHARLTQGADRF